LPLSVVGWPIEGAGDATKMGASASFNECYLPRVRARSRHHRPPKAVAASFELWARKREIRCRQAYIRPLPESFAPHRRKPDGRDVQAAIVLGGEMDAGVRSRIEATAVPPGPRPRARAAHFVGNKCLVTRWSRWPEPREFHAPHGRSAIRPAELHAPLYSLPSQDDVCSHPTRPARKWCCIE
jgi:hypothetical protein